MIQDNVLYGSLHLSLLGFVPCCNGDLRAQVQHGYGEAYTLLTHVDTDTHHVFIAHEEEFLHIEELPGNQSRPI